MAESFSYKAQLARVAKGFSNAGDWFSQPVKKPQFTISEPKHVAGLVNGAQGSTKIK